MDILFTIVVWVLLVVLTAHGLRLTQIAHDLAQAEEASAAQPPPAPVGGTDADARELIGSAAG
jgi:hypothetical protein